MIAEKIEEGKPFSKTISPTNLIQIYTRNIDQLYFIRIGDNPIVRIGKTNNIMRRKKSHQSSNFERLQIISSFNCVPYSIKLQGGEILQENLILNFLEPFKVAGDFFKINDFLLFLIEELVKEDWLISIESIVKPLAWWSGCCCLEHNYEEEAYKYFKLFAIAKQGFDSKFLLDRFFNPQMNLLPSTKHLLYDYYGMKTIKNIVSCYVICVRDCLLCSPPVLEFTVAHWKKTNENKEMASLLRKQYWLLVHALKYANERLPFLADADPITWRPLTEEEVKERVNLFYKLPIEIQEEKRKNPQKLMMH